jgi:hypothetical protein
MNDSRSVPRSERGQTDAHTAPVPVDACPSCGSRSSTVFHSQDRVPAHSCLLLATGEEAEHFARGAIRLALCTVCGCIWNSAFEVSLLSYSAGYEDSQAFSPRFLEYARELVDELVDGYGIHGQTVVEIGCGKADFLLMLCERGGNDGVGIDPAVDPRAAEGRTDVTLLAAEYPACRADVEAGLYVCRHTLEHLVDAGRFLGEIRDDAAGSGSLVYVEVPDVERVLREGAFWDVYYEHCCYFDAGSLGRLARTAGLDLGSTRLGFGGQYLQLFARPARETGVVAEAAPGEFERLLELATAFARHYALQVERWAARLDRLRVSGGRAVLWGSGSKAVAFLTALEAGDEIESVVDINPRKQGSYMAGVTQRIVPPAALVESRPELVIAMNPAYCGEIRFELERLGLEPELVAV